LLSIKIHFIFAIAPPLLCALQRRRTLLRCTAQNTHLHIPTAK
ncbi:MAG: hypothetical protein ACI83D_000173, partial [Planctomycetota bacterium]